MAALVETVSSLLFGNVLRVAVGTRLMLTPKFELMLATE